MSSDVDERKYILTTTDVKKNALEFDNETQWQEHLQSKKWAEQIGYEFDRDFCPAIPRCPSLSKLAIIYEKNGEYEKAISVCENS